LPRAILEEVDVLSLNEGRAAWLAAILPILSIFAVTAVSVVPWRVPDFVAFGLPFLTLGAIFYWAERDRRLLPSPIVLGCGVVTDLVTDGPVGYWALLFLIGLGLGELSGRTAGGQRSISASWFGFAVSLPLIVAIGWGTASLYYLTLLDPRLVLFATAAGIAGYLPLVYLLNSMHSDDEDQPLAMSRRREDVLR
jgi:rod shape-determining protein MreD